MERFLRVHQNLLQRRMEGARCREFNDRKRSEIWKEMGSKAEGQAGRLGFSHKIPGILKILLQVPKCILNLLIYLSCGRAYVTFL